MKIFSALNRFVSYVSESPIEVVKTMALSLNTLFSQKKVKDRAVYKSIRKNDTVIYVGEMNRELLLLMRKQMGASGNLLLFSPTKHPGDPLFKLVQSLRWKNVQNIPMSFSVGSPEDVVAHQSAIKDIVISAELTDRREQRVYRKMEIYWQETLDLYCLSGNIRPDFIYLNLPRHALSILQGSQELLGKFKPRLVIEAEERITGKKKLLQIFSLLASFGYKGFFILDDIHIPLENFDFDIYQNQNFDFYCNQFVFE